MVVFQSLVYLIVLSYNSRRWLPECIGTLSKTKYSNFRILLVDNNSIDGSIEEIERAYPAITIIKNSANYGWCEGNNVGIEEALKNGADYVVFLNSDIKAEDNNWLSELVLFAEKQFSYGVFGCVQYEYNSTNWNNINDWTKYILYNGDRDVFFMWNSKKDIGKNAYSEDDVKTKPFLDCYFVQGAAMMVRCSLIRNIGMFDPIYFIFYDEVDFCRRARLIGYKTALVTTSRIKHAGSGDNSSTKKNQNKRNFYFTRSKYIFLFSDTERKFIEKIKIFFGFLSKDIKDVFNKKEDVSNVFQLIHVLSSLIVNTHAILAKIKKERNI
jgi:GT2 family glycosyltransferase